MSRTTDNGSKSSSTEQLKDDLSQIGETARAIPGHAKGAAVEQYGNLRDQATNVYNQARDTAGEYIQQGKDKLGEYESSLENYVREQPIKSLLIAAGVGVVIGAIWKRL